MTLRADLSMYDAHGRLTAIAEVKNRLGTSGKWAAQTRRNLIAHGINGRSDFFLLITPDRLYIWKHAGPKPVEVPPTYEAEMGPTFAPYFEGAGIVPNEVSGQAFELVVAAWLGDLSRQTDKMDGNGERDWLEQSGFREAVQQGRFELESLE